MSTNTKADAPIASHDEPGAVPAIDASPHNGDVVPRRRRLLDDSKRAARARTGGARRAIATSEASLERMEAESSTVIQLSHAQAQQLRKIEA
jgi:hypothetical protein